MMATQTIPRCSCGGACGIGRDEAEQLVRVCTSCGKRTRLVELAARSAPRDGPAPYWAK